MDKRPIGVFDSGLGGLTTVRELRQLLPREDIVYFGDTGRVPYGTRSRSTLIKYIKQDINFLNSKQVKAVICACGTASSNLKYVDGDISNCVMGVVEPTAKAAVSATKNRRILVLGTQATINSGSYQTAITAISKKIEVMAIACPLFVPLVENGHFDKNDELIKLAATEYLNKALEFKADTVILGCTHYPLLADAIENILGDVCLIDAGKETAIAASQFLEKNGLLSDENCGNANFFVSDAPDNFGKLASVFLGEKIDNLVQYIDIENY